eukprot:TRINITY_DN75337_c0_g1_i1.p2 TRINITY_DN75337_c0_g1~~TRINITY_DN75337_c0_g1_i1.p2  ORF type:complete len:199 (-),score=39.26 TRINITY_DN75337_c0_g1_i1:177-773(-)
MSYETLTLKDYLSIIRFSQAYGVFYLAVLAVSLVLIIFSISTPGHHPLWFVICEGLLTTLFTVEIVLQIAVQKSHYFCTGWFALLDLFFCVVSGIAFVEILAAYIPARNEEANPAQSYEWLQTTILSLRYTARFGRIIFFFRHRSKTHNLPFVDILSHAPSRGPRTSSPDLEPQVFLQDLNRADAEHHQPASPYDGLL